ncbi:hypothetical protein [Niallia taxi]|uniref:hypothetical protein n=1 Tax=Niallia taxi TaxID=2499688 RepID=UPI0015F6FB53|nr:hypothetical protein [Niallia taxi]
MKSKIKFLFGGILLFFLFIASPHFIAASEYFGEDIFFADTKSASIEYVHEPSMNNFFSFSKAFTGEAIEVIGNATGFVNEQDDSIFQELNAAI